MQSESKKGVIILDIDGTLVDSPSRELPSDKVVDAVKCAQKKFHLAVATGRPWQWSRAIVAAGEIESPSVFLGGTEIRDKQGELLWSVSIPDDTKNELLHVLGNFSDRRFLVNDYSGEEYIAGGTIAYDQLEDFDELRVVELTNFEPDIADRLIDQINSVKGLIGVKTTSHTYGTNDVHIMSAFATKEHAITELLKMLQVDVQNTIGVGDGHNDIHLFASVYNKIAMGNSVKELKDSADKVIGDVSQDGLADYLKTLV